MNIPNPLKRTLPFMAIILFGLLAYSNTLNVPFVFDDRQNIAENPAIKDFGYFLEPSKLKNHPKYNLFKSRYVGYLTFALNYRLHALEVISYHLVNVSIHLLNALLIYLIVVILFRSPFLEKSSIKDLSGQAALLSALLFVSHPVQTQAVTYIVQRFASLATMFCLLSIITYIKARFPSRRWYVWYALCLASAVLAMKTKEIAIALPIIIVLLEFLFLKGAIKKRVLYFLPLILAILIVPLSFIDIEEPLADVMKDIGETTRVHTEMQRAHYHFTQLRVIMTYVRLLFLPVGQNLDYDYPIYSSFTDPQVLLSLLALSGLLIIGVYFLCVSRRGEPALRVVSFGMFWFFLALLPESGLITIVDVIFEHRIYFPSIGAAIAVSAGVLILLKKLGIEKHRVMLLPLLIVIPLALAYATHARNAVWKSPVSLWNDVVKKSPGKARGHSNLGEAYFKAGLMDEAIEHYLVAVNLGPDISAIRSFEEVKEIDPNFAKAYNNLGLAYLSKGLNDEAIKNFKVALKIRPDYDKARINLEISYRKKRERPTPIQPIPQTSFH
jgi:tetratricopeptide (TPR) repeat protein